MTFDSSDVVDTVSTMTKPKEVQIRVVFLRIGEIDTLNEKFYAEILVEAKWEEKRLQSEFSGLSNTNDKDLIDFAKYWNPGIYVENSLKLDKMINYKIRKEYAHTSTITTNPLRYTYWMYEYQTIKGYFFEKLELTYFPVDVQCLSIHLTTYKTLREVKFIEMLSKLSLVKHCTLDKHIWHLYEHVDIHVDVEDDSSSDQTDALAKENNIEKNSNDGKKRCAFKSFFRSIPAVKHSATYYFKQFYKLQLRESKTGEAIKHPLIVFKCKAARKSGYYYWNAFLLIFLITSVVFTTFSIDVEQPFYRLPTSATLLLTSVTFRWMYSCRCLPTVDYLTSLDKYSLISIIFIYSACIWHGGVSHMMLFFGCRVEDLRIMDRYVCLAFIVLYFTVQLVLIIWLRRGYLLRQSLKEQDLNYHKRLVKLHYRNSISDKYTDIHLLYEDKLDSRATSSSTSQQTIRNQNKLNFYLTNETGNDVNIS